MFSPWNSVPVEWSLCLWCSKNVFDEHFPSHFKSNFEIFATNWNVSKKKSRKMLTFLWWTWNFPFIFPFFMFVAGEFAGKVIKRRLFVMRLKWGFGWNGLWWDWEKGGLGWKEERKWRWKKKLGDTEIEMKKLAVVFTKEVDSLSWNSKGKSASHMNSAARRRTLDPQNIQSLSQPLDICLDICQETPQKFFIIFRI
jgi:hypothetical protein